LKRSESFPARLPSDTPPRADVKAARKPISRPEPDLLYTRESFDFRRHAGGRRAGAELKKNFMDEVKAMYPTSQWLRSGIEGRSHYRGLLESVHPKYDSYSPEQKTKAIDDLAHTHPKLLAEQANWRNRKYGVPNFPTANRLMKTDEQKFLSQAMRLIREDVEKHPFHIHGESGVVGDKHGQIREHDYNPAHNIKLTHRRGDKYVIHSHPPFLGLFSSSPSDQDHKVAALTYLEFNSRTKEYLTNGKDVLEIPSDSLQLIQLHPRSERGKGHRKIPRGIHLTGTPTAGIPLPKP
jgi:hypothetical protein